jgi:3',5'-nucleoside bisphosphate phosphatase
LERLRSKGLALFEEEVQALAPFSQSLGRPHVALAMVKRGYVSSTKEAFISYLGEGKSCFVPGEELEVIPTMELLHQAGGKAFIAHPQWIPSFLLNRLLDLPFDGIECFYSTNLPGMEKRWVRIAEKKGWLMSGGSDFHGDFKEAIPLGCSFVNQAQFRSIFSRPFFK